MSSLLSLRPLLGGVITAWLGVSPHLAAQTATPAPKDDIINLAAFDVSAAKMTGYRAANAVTATGIGTDIIDTPIAINVVTGEFLQDTAAFELRQALDFAPGVRTQENNESRIRVRGFDALSLLRNGHYRRQLFASWNIDRIEVIKGATAIFHGSNRPGGIINYLTRKPSFTGSTEAKVLVASHEHYRTEVSTTGPVNDQLAYRVGAGAYTAGGFRDFWHNRGNYAAGAVTYRPNAKVDITAEYEHVSQNISDQQSTELFVTNNQLALARIYPAGDPTGFNYNLGGPDSFRKYSTDTLDLDVRLRLTDRIVYRLEANVAEDNFRVLRTQGTRENAGANAGTVTIRFGDYANYRDSWDIKNSLIGQFALGASAHTVMLGHQSNETRQRTPGFGRKNGRDGPNFRYNPTTGAFPEFPTLAPQYPLKGLALLEGIGTRTADGVWNDNRRIKEISNAYYLIDTVDLMSARLKVMAGARYTQIRRTLAWDSLPAIATADSIVQDRVTPQFALLYKLNPEWSVFATYSQSLEPQNQVDADGNAAGPVEGAGYEIGIKADAFERRLAATLSLFEIERSNTATRDTVREAQVGRSPLFFFGNTETVQGFEADVAYNPTNAWQVLLTYTWLWQSETTAAQDPTRIGTPFTLTPEQTFNVWTKYVVPSGPAKGLELGGGFRWDGGYLLTALIETGASHRFDLLVRYPLTLAGRRVSLSANLNNVSDEKNLGGGLNWTNPREFTLSASTRF